MDPEVRAWVVATLFESSVTMCRLSGQPLDQATMERLYAEFRAFLAALGDEAGHLPSTLPEFWQYYDRMVAEELQNTEALRIILFKLFEHLPAPPLFAGLPTVWATGRALAGPVIGTITVASLPEAFRRRAGLPEVPGAQTLMQSAYMAARLARALPDNWLQTENVVGLLHLSPDGDGPGAETLAALRARMKRAGALFRLIAPVPAAGRTLRAGPSTGAVPASSSPRCWTRPGTAIWTGPTSPPWHGNSAPVSTWTSRRRPGCTTRSPPGGGSSRRLWTPTVTAG